MKLTTSANPSKGLKFEVLPASIGISRLTTSANPSKGLKLYEKMKKIRAVSNSQPPPIPLRD